MPRASVSFGKVRQGTLPGQLWRLVNAYAEARYRVGCLLDGDKRRETIARAQRLEANVKEALKARTMADVEAQLTAAGIPLDWYVAG